MRMMDVDKLNPHPKNSYFFDDIDGEPWVAFLESIETSGVIEPIIVSAPDLTIVSGHQRVRACKKLGIKQVAVEERSFDSEDEILKQLIETNIRQRGIGNANAVKLGRCIKELERIYGIKNGNNQHAEPSTNGGNHKTQADLIAEFDTDKETYRRGKKLAELPEEFQQMVMEEKITPSTASRMIARLTPEEQKQLLEQIGGKEKLSGKEVEAEIAKLKAENKRLKDDNLALARRAEPKVVEKTVEIEVVPDDYEELKRKTQTYEADNKRLNREYKQVTSELADAKRQLKESKSPSADDKVVQSAKESMDNFSIATYDFIRRYGGNVWSFDKWADVPDSTRTNFAKAIQALSAFAQQMADNIAGIE